MNDDYALHSALSKELETPALVSHEGANGLSLAYDVAAMHGLPDAFASVDVLYAEPPFPAGWKTFHDRVDLEPAMSYKEFIALCSRQYLFRPGVLILGNQATRYAGPARAVTRHLLHRKSLDQVNALWYGIDPPEEDMANVTDVINHLATQFDTVGDFCCGYGVTGRIFADHGKRYVMSDVNPRCVGYIAAQEWA